MDPTMTLSALLLACSAACVHAGAPSTPVDSSSPVTWTQKQKPFRIYGNTYYVGSRGLSAILITSPQGYVLIDGTLPENAAMIESNVRALGFRVQDIKLILNTHTHHDHAGAIAAIAHDSGAQVAANAISAKALEHGGDDPDDPQRGMGKTYPKVEHVRIVTEGETLHVGPLALQMHAMPGHMPGGTGWTWRSCEHGRCLSIVYADSITLLSNHDYRYTDPAHPERIAGYRHTLAILSTLPCDILLIPHPPQDFFQRVAHITPGKSNPLVDPQACKAYAQEGQSNLQERLRLEAKTQAAH
ncbi:subclass B3 metallo-beta-lactamase [Dyella monticola]|uniref:Subclass B3 metallo-beta-lactamase n=1 Tax=Dyella monticola TaxID=1927958 RepID=A0A370WYU7_9GAMM|nr:subclass B3 metallo-beta-lactamase [Dyella monticola]RDS81266.1 subclass B3 metallo-beta-lactamase [Dyella monticola]